MHKKLYNIQMNEKPTHAYIVNGAYNDAAHLAAALVCERGGTEPCGDCPHCRKSLRGIHPDIETVTPPADKKQIPIDTVRTVVHDAHIAPTEADVRVFIFDNAGETLRADAQNALLKLLEEPPPHTRIILRAEPGALLPTVRSRCRTLTFDMPEPVVPQELSVLLDALFDAMQHGETALTEFSFALEKLPRADLSAFLTAVRGRVATQLRSGADNFISHNVLTSLVRALGEAEKYAAYNVGMQHIAARICAELSAAITIR